MFVDVYEKLSVAMCRDGSYRAAATAAAGRPWRPGAEATRRRGSSSAQDLANFFFFSEATANALRFFFLFSRRGIFSTDN